MSGTLPAWIERLLGIHAEPGEGTLWTLEHSWSWPPWMTLLLAVFAVVFVVAIYLYEGRRAAARYRMMLAAIRLGLIALVLLMIAQVGLSLKRTGLPYVAVLIDDSLSMTIVDRYEDKRQKALKQRLEQTSPGGAELSRAELSRWNLAQTLLSERNAAMLDAMGEKYKLRVHLLCGSLPGRTADAGELAEKIRMLQPTGESSRLGDAVRTVLDQLRGTTPAAIVMLTDGINTDGASLDDAASLARRKGVPLFTVGLGSDKPLRDLKLSDLLVEPIVFVNDVVNFECRLTGTDFQGSKVRLVLRRQGKPDVLASRDVTVGPDGQPQQVCLPYRPRELGSFRYVVEVEPQEGELQTDNNRQARQVEIRKETIRVLLAQGYPNYEFRYLQEMLKRDETIELNTVPQDADREYLEQDSAALPVFPVRRDELFAYDVIILGDVDPKLLSGPTLQNLADFVDQPGKGGALILIAGYKQYMPAAYRDTPLERLLPVNLSSLQYPEEAQTISEGFVVQPTELGLASPPMQLGDAPQETPSIWQNLPPLYWLLEAPDLKPAARILAEHPTRRGHDGRPLPVICLQYVGAGKVLFHATDETWRWRRRVGDLYFARYWVQMIRYLSRSKLAGEDRTATLSADRREYARGEPVRLRVQFPDERLAPPEDDGVTVVLERHRHKTRRIPLRRSTAGRGTFEATLDNLAAGDYHAWVALPTMEGRAPAVDFSVVAPPGELERVRMDAAALRRAAKRTKGRFYTFETAHRLLKHLPPGHHVPIESLPPKPLWNMWPVLLLALILLITEWVLRKRGAMV